MIKIKAVWAILRGRTVVYRANVGGVTVTGAGAVLAENVIG